MTKRILQSDEKEEIIAIVKNYCLQCKVIAFGSRIEGTAHDGSDLDLAIDFYNPDSFVLNKFNNIKQQLKQSFLPYFVDLHIWNELPIEMQANIKNSKNEVLYEGIDRGAIRELEKKFEDKLLEQITNQGEETFWQENFILIKTIENCLTEIKSNLYFLKKARREESEQNFVKRESISKRLTLISLCGFVYQMMQKLCGFKGNDIKNWLEEIKQEYKKDPHPNSAHRLYYHFEILNKFQKIYQYNTTLRHPNKLKEQRDILWVFQPQKSEEEQDLIEMAEYLEDFSQGFFSHNFCPNTGWENEIERKTSLYQMAENYLQKQLQEQAK